MHVSEYEVETKFIDRLESIGYEYIDLKGQSLFLWDLTHDPTKIYTGRHPCLNPEGMLGSI